MQSELSSSQEFIRALKGSKDPPKDGGLLKVDLARRAWELESLFIPSKAEVIVEWALQSLLANGQAERDFGLDGKTWRLLADIIVAHKDLGETQSGPSSRRSWLNGIVNRVPVLPVFTSLLHTLGNSLRPTTHTVSEDSLLLVLGAATDAAHALLPLASLKASCDAVATCFWEVLGLFSARDIQEKDLVASLDLCETIVSTFEASFGNHSNKKKIAALLVDKHLSSWLLAIETSSNRRSEAASLAGFRQRLFVIGCSVVFSPEYTRAIFQNSDSHPVLLATVSAPRLFGAYVSALRTHKLSVFLDQTASAGGLAKRIRGAARQLFSRSIVKCEWSTVAQLVQTAEELNVVDDEWADDFGALVELATQALKKSWNDEQAQVAIHVCSTLGSVLRLHAEVVEPHTGLLLSGLCAVPEIVLSAASSVLELLLDHHSKARTLHTYLPQLTKSLSDRPSAVAARTFYQAACVGPVLDPAHLAKLRRSVSAFITPGQILPCTRQLLIEFASTLATVSKVPEPPRKKRRTSGPAVPGGDDVDETGAVHVGLSSRLLVAILGSLPVKTLKPDALEQLRTSVDQFDRSVLLETLNGPADTLKQSWGRQVIFAAVLRIRYGLRQSHCPVRTSADEDRSVEAASLFGLLRGNAVSAELVTEVVRVLTQGQRPRSHLHDVWSLALSHLQNSVDQQSATSWNGSLAHLSNHAWFPLWLLLLDRQLDIIESSLTSEQLQSVLDLFMDLNRGVETSNSVTSRQIFTKAITSARFWEMPNLRKALNEKLAMKTNSLDQVDLHKALKTMRKGKLSKHAGSHEGAIAIYHIAALCPPEYLERSTRTVLLARAPCADVLATQAKDREVVRVVLRQLSSGNAGVLPEEYVRYLLDPHLQSNAASNDLTSVKDTLSILGASFRLYARLAKDNGTQGDLTAVLRSVTAHELFGAALWGSQAASLSIRATLQLLDTIADVWGLNSTPPENIRACIVQILDQIRNCVEHSDIVTDLLIDSARTLAVCERWLQLGTLQTPRRARRLLRQNPLNNSVATEALLRLLTEEIRNANEDSRLLLATFALHTRSHNGTTADAEQPFGEACRKITPDQHSVLTNEIVSWLLEPEADYTHLIMAIRMGSLALRHAPEGTSSARRRSATVFLRSLAQVSPSPKLQEACTTFIAEICGDRANALTAPDMAAIWILLDRATGSTGSISLGAYSNVVAALSSIVRFRRDLLTPNLPQLSAILARLIHILRLRTSHTIGAPQSNISSQAPSTGHATELARLLVGLSTKTAVRPALGGKPDQHSKVESLARPFARHAPYLLVAYAESAAEMSVAVRAALKPGLFALCAMSGVPARDMVMVTMLDTVEKEVFGNVWREWEAQKYAGKG